MKLSLILSAILGLCGILTNADAAIHNLTITGNLLHFHEDPHQDFPAGAEFTLILEIDDEAENRFLGGNYRSYTGAIGDYSFSIPSSGFSINGTASASQEIKFYYTDHTERSFNSPMVELDLKFTNPITNKKEGLLVTWYKKRDGQPPSTEITQDLTPSAFRFVQVSYYEATVPFPQEYCFGWARQQGVTQASGTPEAIPPTGYDQFVVFGDSLSESYAKPSQDPTKYFAYGNTNGPVWIQYLSWLTDIPYRNEWNFSAFGGFVGPTEEEIQGHNFSNSLGAYWSQSGPFSAIAAFILGSNAEGLADAIRSKDQSDFLRGIEAAYDMGIRHLILLSPADISIAPMVRAYLTPAQLTIVSNMIRSMETDYLHYVDQWFTGLFPGMKVSWVDPNTYLDEFMQDPASFGITNLDGYHLASGPTPYTDYFGNPGSTYFFWDNSAPSTKVHAHLAAKIYDHIFATIPLDDKPTQLRLLQKNANDVWLLGINPPKNTPVGLQQSENLEFTTPATKISSGPDQLLFYIAPATTPKNFYRLSD